jgi:hypothetical protein
MGSRRTGMLRCSPILAGTLVVLSISLFSWGLAYKLSLYRSQQFPPRMVAAKLLSQKERPVAALTDKAIRLSVPASAFALTQLPYSPLSSVIYAPSLEVLSLHPGVKELFTVHTDRKPPPNLI